jgi:hypothetical protein
MVIVGALPDELPLSDRLVQSVGPPISVDDAQIQALERSLESSGLTGLLKTAREIAPEGCPTIFSNSYCDRLNAGGDEQSKIRAENEIRVRNLGKRMLRELDAESTRLTRPGIEAAEARTKAEQMLALSDWFLKGDGYGNGVIASRCRQLGAVAAARVVIEGSIPLEEAGSLVDSLGAFDEVEWFKWLIRAHEREAPGVLAPFVRKMEKPEEIRRELLQVLVRGESILKENGVRMGEGPVGRELEATRRERIALAPSVAIFLEDPPMGGTTLEQWDLYRLVPEPLHIRILNDLQATMFFRKHIGGFPLEPLPEGAIKDGKLSSLYSSRTHAAFSRAWDEFSTRKEFLNSDLRMDPVTGRMVVDPNAERLSNKYLNMGIGSNAARIYDAVTSGRFDNYLQSDAPKH